MEGIIRATLRRVQREIPQAYGVDARVDETVGAHVAAGGDRAPSLEGHPA